MPVSCTSSRSLTFGGATTLMLASVVASAVTAAAPRAANAPAAPQFVDAARASGLVFTHTNGAAGRYDLPEIMGAGGAFIDYDRDGDLDVFLVQGAAAAGGRAASSRLFRNDLTVGADGRRTLHFTDVTDRAHVGFVGQGMGAAVADYDNDGWPDLYVTAAGEAALYRNNHDGTFTDTTRAAGVSDRAWSTGAAFFDYDRDGWLDLFVAHYVDVSTAPGARCTDPSGARDYCQPRRYRALPDRLYRNLKNGRFADVTAAAGIAKAFGAGLGVAAGDFDRDGWLDLYVANDAMPNQLWMNRHDGTFVDRGFLSGSAVNAAGRPEGSMGIAPGDFDGDGDEDLFVTNIVGETFAMYVNTAPGLFEDARTRTGLGAPTAAGTGFGTGWFDYDNDGWLDLFMANGAVSIVPAERGEARPYRMRNQLFRNTGTGRFVDSTADAGPDVSRLEVGRGAAFGDVDNDGDVDVLVTNNGGAVELLLNQGAPGTHWLGVELEQGPGNRRGYGARVGLERAGRPTMWRRVRTDGSYLSASDSRLHFGLGAAAGVTAILVEWPDGARERWPAPAVDRTMTLVRGTGRAAD